MSILNGCHIEVTIVCIVYRIYNTYIDFIYRFYNTFVRREWCFVTSCDSLHDKYYLYGVIEYINQYNQFFSRYRFHNMITVIHFLLHLF
jgi:hypothetical protein